MTQGTQARLSSTMGPYVRVLGRGEKREEGKEGGREEKEGEKESVSYPRQ